MHDVAVIGLGAMGSSAAFHLASRGAHVVGVDMHSPPHNLGSTHGASRIIREAYFEDPSYVPLVRRAYENWATLERESGTALFTRTGGLMIGAPQSGLIRGTIESAEQHGIAIELLESRDIRARFPVIVPDDGMIGVLERRAGILDPEASVTAYLELARKKGAELHLDCCVSALDVGDAGCRVRTNRGDIIARQVVVAAGAWTRQLLLTLGLDMPLEVERQTMHWYTPQRSREQFSATHLPVTLIEHASDRYVYFIPDQGEGVKAAIHYEGAVGDPGQVDRAVSAGDVSAVAPLLARYLPALGEVPHRSAVCLYTNTPDRHFLVDEVPGHHCLRVISACSGHGFKFASAIGEVVAQEMLDEAPVVDMSIFRGGRLDFRAVNG